MQEPILSEKIFKIITQKSSHPFDTDFDPTSLSEKFGGESTLKEKEVLKFVILVNKFYVDIKGNFFDVFKTLNYTKIELINFLYKAVNKYHLDILPRIQEQLSNSDNVGFNASDFEFSKFLFEDGNKVNVKQIVEIGGDVLALLILIVERWNPRIDDFYPKIDYEDSKLGGIFNFLWFNSNILLNLETAYETLIYENSDIEIYDDLKTIKIKTGNKWINVITSAAETRFHSNLNEFKFPLQQLYSKVEPKKIGAKDIIFNRGTIKIKKGTVKTTENKALIESFLMTRFHLFENEKIEYLNNLTIGDVSELLVLLVEIINKCITKISQLPKNLLYDTPYRVEKEHLMIFLIEASDYEFVTIEKVLKSLINTDTRPYYWRKPFIEINGFIYFNIISINSPNFTLLFESILRDSNYTSRKQETLLSKAISSELKLIKEEYQFDEINIESLEIDNTNFSNNLLYELLNYNLLLEPHCYEHPIESSEIFERINEIGVLSSEIHKKVELLKRKLAKPILPVIISNYNTFSTLNINDVTIIDLQLLKNYFITGQFRRGKLIFGKKGIVQKEYANIQYYINEEEFNDNFFNFLVAAAPVRTIANRIVWKEIEILPNNISPKLIIDSIDLIEQGDDIKNQLRILENALNHKFYYDHKERLKELYNKSISYHLSDTIHKLAFAEYEVTKFKIDLLELFRNSKLEGFFHLINYISVAFSNISFSKIKKDKKFKQIKSQPKDFKLLMDRIFEMQKIQGIRLYDFKINSGILTKQEEKRLISIAMNTLAYLGTSSFDDDHFENFFLQLAIIKAYKTKYGLDYEFYAFSNNLLDSLNFNNKYQRARNFAQEILAISIKDKKHHYGWGLLFKCFTYQKNNFEAAIYGCLYYTSLSKLTVLSYSDSIDAFYNALKFYREFHLLKSMDDIMNFIDKMSLNKYDLQKFKLSYYLGNLLRLKERPELIVESLDYIENNFKSIKSFGVKGLYPWLNYLMNLKKINLIDLNSSEARINELIKSFKNVMDTEDFTRLFESHFGDLKTNKQNLIKALISTYETNTSSDLEYEMKHLELIAKRLLKQACKVFDIDSLLLSSLVLNEGKLGYDDKYFPENTITKVTLEVSDELRDKLYNYYSYIQKNISLKKKCLLVWLFTVEKDTFRLQLNSSGNYDLYKVNDWDRNKLRAWVDKKEHFYFDSSKYFDVAEQENKYLATLNQLSFANLSLSQDYDELYICNSIDLSVFPSNLLIDNDNFISSKVPVTNIISLEWYLKYGGTVILDKNFDSTAWIPIEDEDFVLSVSHSKLEPILKRENVKIITSRLIPEKIKSSVNIFLAHGEVGFKTFRGIYTNQNSESVILNPEYLFGEGEIALLFICNSGVAQDDVFANSVTSLCYEILKSGYKSVIAPFWKLDSRIPSFWFDTFITNFKSGKLISESVFLANKELTIYKEDISNSFVVPEGRLAMHLYGNPNLRVKQ